MERETGILIYRNEDGEVKIDVKLENETLWMTQKAIAELFQTTTQNITIHIKNIYNENELDEAATCKEYLQVQNEGKRKVKRKVIYYNLKIIIAIGYRTKSQNSTHFRRWATERLEEYFVKGFIMDDERLKEGKNIGEDYFEELLDRIRDIRASEKRLYKKITDIYALSSDYEPKSESARSFFATVQNKLHFAITGYTAAEIINQRVDAAKENMGLTTWKNSTIRQKDVIVAKNYLDETEIKELNKIVTMYLDYAEEQAKRKIIMHMKDWEDKLNKFLEFNDREILEGKGSITKEIAHDLAKKEYKKYNQEKLKNDLNKKDDFDRFVEEDLQM